MHCKFNILKENLHRSIAVYGGSFLTDVFTLSNVNTSSGCIMFTCSYAVALFRYVNGRGNVTYFLFDLQCRIVVELQMGNQVFQFLSSFKACFKLGGISRKHIRFLVYPPCFQIQYQMILQ